LEFSDTAVREGRTWVATARNVVVGFHSILISPDSAELEDLFVDPDWTRQGVGRSLVDHASVAVGDEGFTHLDVDANPEALGFYLRAGFVDCGPKQLEHGMAIRMRRDTGRSKNS
jgi:GNAT superfamily N-acetyltransferase